MKRSGEWRATAMLLVASALAALLGYLWTLVAARFFSTSQYGDFLAAASILFFAVIALGPISQSVAYFVAHGSGPALPMRAERAVIRVGGWVAILIIVASRPLARLLAFASPAPIIAVAVCAYIFAVLSVRRGFVQGESRFTAYASNVAIESALRVAAIVAIGFVRPTAFAGVMTYAFSTAVAFLLLKPTIAREKADLRPLLRYFAPAFAYTAIYAAFLNSDVVFAKLFFPGATAAVYAAASFLGRAAAVLVMPFYVLAVPQMVEARHDKVEVRRRAIRILVQYSALSFASIVVLAVARNLAVAILLGRAYAGAALFVVPISVAVALEGFVFLLCQLPVARGDFRFVPWYAAGYVVELVIVSMAHATPATMLFGVIAAQIVTILLVSWRAR